MHRFFIGPMSKEIVDIFLKNDNNSFAFIPSRRQIDYESGYVNNWTTQTFSNYVKSKNSNFLICRDHAGSDQGKNLDDGFQSLKHDCEYFDMIHVDPWKSYQNLDDAISMTCNYIKFCNSLNNNIVFEISTEESICYINDESLIYFITNIKKNLGRLFDKVTHIVIQSGTRLHKNIQIGEYSPKRLENQIKIVKNFDKFSKEHNGDYIDVNIIKEKFDMGLDSINIAPEFGYIQTCAILDCMDENQIENFYELCFKSNSWKKWVNEDFDPSTNKLDLIKICGHYIYSHNKFLELVQNINYKEVTQKYLQNKINNLTSIFRD